ncbi:MAG: TonB-dependent receptor [Paludibacter sp.]|nr:TonB-dependent receptor [Paludibacter sp.]
MLLNKKISCFLFWGFIIMFWGTPMQTFAQKTMPVNKVMGRVYDENQNDPLIGVNIIVKGKPTGTVSGLNGTFSVSAEIGDVIKFSYIGYKDKEIKVATSVLNVAMTENALKLGEVVVEAGYGTMKKRDITGSIVSVNEKEIEKKMSVNVLDALQGAASGVQVSNASGAPGEESSIRIRGTSTLSDDGVAPLFIVDGMTVDRIDDINPNDIQSVEVLKDASSSAIYGSRSANGVIIITTKKGNAGKPKLDAKYLRSYSQLSHKLPQANSLERRIFENRIYTLPGVTKTLNDSTALTTNTDNDYQDILTQTGVRNQLDLSLTGGTRELKYFNSLQYYDETGIVRNSWLKRLTGRVNIDYVPNKIVKTATRIGFSKTSRNEINEGMVLVKALLRNPYFILTFPDGTPAYDIAGQKNPIAEEILRKNETNQYNLNFIEEVNVNLGSCFIFHTDVSGKFDLKRNEKFNSKLLSTAKPKVNSGSETSYWNTYLSTTSYLTFKRKFNKKTHAVEATLGTSVEDWNTIFSSLGGINYVSEVVTTGNSISELDPTLCTSNKEDHSMIGIFLRGRYSYKDRYLINGTIRRDGSSRFGANNRWGWFPSVSGAWRFTDESFANEISKVLSDGKLRFGWGVTGNERIGNYDSQNQYIFGDYYYNDVSGVIPNTTLGNPNLKWEETRQSNVGLDLMFLDGRINMVVDYYIKNTKDLLYLTSLPQESGFTYAWTNFGAMQNKGLEITLSATPVKMNDFSWLTTINYSQNKNVITDLAGVNRADDIWWIGEGYEAGAFYGYKYQGIYQYDESNAWTEDFKTNLIPVFQKDAQGNVIIGKDRKPSVLEYLLPDGSSYTGAVKSKTTNGIVCKGGDVIWEEVADKNGNVDGDVNSEDRQVLGSGQPKWYGSWSNTLTYKNFNLSFSFYGNFGNMIYNEMNRNSAALISSGSTPTPFIVYNLWKYPGQITPLYNANDRSANNARTDDSYFLEDGSFIRLQSIRFGYTMDSELIKKVGLTAASIYLYGNGLATWTNYTGYDPEVAQNSVLKPGKDKGRYPRKREFGLSINVSL